jgi:diacylglycerol O-acyltransferase / wax synthase
VMNITVYSYAQQMFFGMIAGYEAMPHLPEMRSYIREALEALEHEVAAVLAGLPDVDPREAAGPGGAVAGTGGSAPPASAREKSAAGTRKAKAAARKPSAAKAAPAKPPSKASARKPAATGQ